MNKAEYFENNFLVSTVILFCIIEEKNNMILLNLFFE